MVPRINRSWVRTGPKRSSQSREGVFQGEGLLVPPGHDPDWKRPWNGQCRVIEAHCDVLRRIVRAVDAIGDISNAGECLESMGTSVGDVQRPLLVPLQFEALPVPIGRRARAEVDDDIEDRPIGASDQFRLPEPSPDVETTHHPTERSGDAVLSEAVRIDSCLARNCGVKGPAEEAPIVDDRSWLEHQHTSDSLDLVYLHRRNLALIFGRPAAAGRALQHQTLGLAEHTKKYSTASLVVTTGMVRLKPVFMAFVNGRTGWEWLQLSAVGS